MEYEFDDSSIDQMLKGFNKLCEIGDRFIDKITKEQKDRLKETKAHYYRRLARKFCSKAEKEAFMEQYKKDKEAAIRMVRAAEQSQQKFKWMLEDDDELLRFYRLYGNDYSLISRMTYRDETEIKKRLDFLRRFGEKKNE